MTSTLFMAFENDLHEIGNESAYAIMDDFLLKYNSMFAHFEWTVILKSIQDALSEGYHYSHVCSVVRDRLMLVSYGRYIGFIIDKNVKGTYGVAHLLHLNRK